MNSFNKKRENKIIRSGFSLFLLLSIFAVAISIGTKLIKVDIDASTYTKDIPGNYTILAPNSDLNSLNKKSVLFFNSSWCSTCSRISTYFKSAAQKNTDTQFYEINIDDNRDLANSYKVSLTPTIVVINNAQALTFEEIAPTDLDKVIAKLSL